MAHTAKETFIQPDSKGIKLAQCQTKANKPAVSLLKNMFMTEVDREQFWNKNKVLLQVVALVVFLNQENILQSENVRASGYLRISPIIPVTQNFKKVSALLPHSYGTIIKACFHYTSLVNVFTISIKIICF